MPRSALVQYPPEPVAAEPVSSHSYLTPPPSPRLGQRAQWVSNGNFIHWGHLKPVNAKSSYNKWVFSRQKPQYRIGYSREMDIRIATPGIAGLHCTMIWDGTDDVASVRIISYVQAEPANALSLLYADAPSSVMRPREFGTYVNERLLPCGVPHTVRHGDCITLQGVPAMEDDDDLRFVWLQCTRGGWLPLQYRQDSPFDIE